MVFEIPNYKFFKWSLNTAIPQRLTTKSKVVKFNEFQKIVKESVSME